jgi:eukaryotic-like serine/threonine-protein kinase
MTICQHCGRQHRNSPDTCPKTGLSMTTGGLIGTQVDRYVIETLLGAGGFGSVYRARHTRTKAHVALKLLKPELVADSTTLERFLREASTAAAIGSDHIVRVLDAEVTADGQAFIAMELLDGDDLKVIARREGPLHPARVVQVCLQVLQGLAAAHEKGIVHRDMKPGNVFISRRLDARGREVEHAQVLDFGISKVAGGKALTVAGVTMGTPSYMAWEQFADARQVDARTDLYAVAVMLFELLSGQKPFDADDLAAMMNKVRIEERPELRTIAPSLPVPLCAVVEKGLQKQRERRWQTAHEFGAALQRASILLPDAPPLPPRPPKQTLAAEVETVQSDEAVTRKM